MLDAPGAMKSACRSPRSRRTVRQLLEWVSVSKTLGRARRLVGRPERSTAVRLACSLPFWFLYRVGPPYVEDPLPTSLSPILARQDGKANTTAQTLDPAGNAGSESGASRTSMRKGIAWSPRFRADSRESESTGAHGGLQRG